MVKLLAENLPRFAWSTPQRQKLKFLPLRRYNLTLNLLSRSHDRIASGRQIAINGHIKFNLTIPLQQLNGLETLVIIMVANKYAFLQITRRRFLNEWEAFKKVISRRNIRRRITIPLTLSNLKLLRRITRTENILHRNFTRRQVAIQNRVRSEERFSRNAETDLVCRLLLEKKNPTTSCRWRSGASDRTRAWQRACPVTSSTSAPRPSSPPWMPSTVFFKDTATTEIYTLSLHDALPIYTTDPQQS